MFTLPVEVVDTGAAYFFSRNTDIWSQKAYLKASNTGEFDEFGRSVAISEIAQAIGTELEDSNAAGTNGDGSNNLASLSGAVYVFASDLIFSDGFEDGL